MLFSSIPFIYYFLPAVLICYFLVPGFLKNTVLMLFSLFFYAWGEPKYVLIMLALIIVGYVSGLLLEKFRGAKFEKLILTISVTICLAGLIYFKYANFFISNFNAVTGLSIPLLKLLLPIGISFYTFQILSYIVDVYRADTRAQSNIISLAAYVTLFSQLIAGPIVRYTDIEDQIDGREHNVTYISYGIRRFIIGLSKKILVANILGELVDIFRASDEKTIGFYWIYAVAFTLHIYYDFSAYSDMAIGLGRIFGFHFPENFDYPYVSASITEFWRRWHMTLGSWFRDYVYIPLGGNRVGRMKWYRNILVVWLLTGFWHGADWNFIIWGLYYAVFLIIEKAGLLGFLRRHKILSHIYVIFLVAMGFVVFNAENLGQMSSDFEGLFGLAGVSLWNEHTAYYFKSYIVIIIIACIGATPLPRKLAVRFKNLCLGVEVTEMKKAVNSDAEISDISGRLQGDSVLRDAGWGVLEAFSLVGLLLVCTAFLVDGSFNPFLYFRF